MLPSTGYFKETNCPFFDTGLCERPYCHFRHVKKEPPDCLPPVESGSSLEGNNELLQKLVSEAVKKVLKKTENPLGAVGSLSCSTPVETVSQSSCTKIVYDPIPPTTGDSSTQKSSKVPSEQTKCPTKSSSEQTKVPAVSSSEQTKVPSYKPTPIAMLKKRHIPIPYSPTPSKSSNILLKRRSSSDVTNLHKRPKLSQEYEPDSNSAEKTSESQCSASVVSSTVKCDPSDKSKSSSEPIGADCAVVDNTNYKVSSVSNTCRSSETSFTGKDKSVNVNYESDYDPYDADMEKVSGYSCDQSSKYSPVPVSGWNNNCHSYTPSTIESLQLHQNNYVPSSKNPDQQSTVQYEPSEKSKSSSEPTYIPLGADGAAVDSTSYRPSSVSNSEPEYQPHSTDTLTKEYVPTDISKLDIKVTEKANTVDLDFLSSDIDLLHDILNEDLKGSVSDNDTKDCAKQRGLKKKKDGKGKKTEVAFNGEGKLSVKKSSPLLDVGKGDMIKDLDRARTSKMSDKESGSAKRKRDSDKNKCDSNKKQSKSDVKYRKSGKKHLEGERKQIESDKKHSESERVRCIDSKKESVCDKKESISAKKESVSAKKQSDIDRKKSDSESDRDRKRSESKNSESDKNRSNDKKRSDTEKKHSIPADSGNSKYGLNELGDSNKCDVSSERHKSTRHVGNSHNDKESSKDQKKPRQKGGLKHKSDRHVSNNHNRKEMLKREKEPRKKDSSKEKHSQSKSTTSKHKVVVSVEKSLERVRVKSSKVSSKKFADKKYSVNSKSRSEDFKRSNKEHLHQLQEIQHEVCSSEVDSVVSDNDTSDECVAMDTVTLPSDMGASSSDEEVTKECFRIFQEYEPTKVINKHHNTRKMPQSVNETEPPAIGKKRVAHEGSQNSMRLYKPIKRGPPVNPGQMMAERIRKLKEAQTAQTLETFSAAGPLGLPVTSPPSGRIRIAHVPNVSLLLNAKLKVQERLKERQEHPVNVTKASLVTSSVTITQSAPKGGQRIAHVPSMSVLSRPIITEIGGRIPANVRQNYLNIMIGEFLKLGFIEEEAFEKAEQEEKAIYSRSTTRIFYSSHMSNTINRLRKGMHNRQEGSLSNASTSRVGVTCNRTMSHMSMLAGKGGAKGSWSIEKPKKAPTIMMKNLYEEFHRFILTEDELRTNGYPHPHPDEKGVAVLHATYRKPILLQNSMQRVCARCSNLYFVNKRGMPLKEEQCIYHWGRMFQSRVHGLWEGRYVCCQGHPEAIGCAVGPCHVSDGFDPSCLRGYVKTLPKEEPPADGDYGIYALDCEMCYTTAGLELTRVTVIGTNMETVYETLVKPECPILDYNTRFSGIKEEDMADVRTNIYEVQSALLSFISHKTILVGHSLESDFKALKLIHTTVVDTSVVFPHKHGPPKKRALKTLCRELLHKLIQDGDQGHDSAEDAKACMELMLYKIKDELKKC